VFPSSEDRSYLLASLPGGKKVRVLLSRGATWEHSLVAFCTSKYATFGSACARHLAHHITGQSGLKPQQEGEQRRLQLMRQRALSPEDEFLEEEEAERILAGST
jgi:hypothetical protein